MKRNFPTLKYKTLLKIIKRYCGEPIRQRGSHMRFESSITGLKFTFAERRGGVFESATVKQILMEDIGLTEEQAREEVEK